MRAMRWTHWIAALLLLAEVAVVMLIFVPRVDAFYRAQFIERTDCLPASRGIYRLGTTVRPLFDTPDASANGVFACGWRALADGAWSMGRGAHLLFQVPEGTGELELRLLAGGLVAPDLPLQHVEVAVNGQPLNSFELDQRQATEQVLAIPAELARNQFLDIALRFPDATPPHRLGLGTDRALRAMFLEAVTLMPK